MFYDNSTFSYNITETRPATCVLTCGSPIHVTQRQSATNCLHYINQVPSPSECLSPYKGHDRTLASASGGLEAWWADTMATGWLDALGTRHAGPPQLTLTLAQVVGELVPAAALGVAIEKTTGRLLGAGR